MKINCSSNLPDHIHSIVKILSWEPFDIINGRIIEKLIRVGVSKISDALLLFMGDKYSYKFSDDDNQYLEMYDKLFVSTGVTHSIGNMGVGVHIARVDPFCDVLIDNAVEITIGISNNEIITIQGYFRNDDLNIITRTSQICHNFIHKKKKLAEEYINKKPDIDPTFKKVYIKNLSICSILTLGKKKLCDMIDSDYLRYNKLAKLTLMNLMKEFVKDTTDPENVKNMYDVIRILLLGTDDNANIAGLLFGIIKDKRLHNETVANIIYSNLSYSSQIRLKRTAINIKNELEQIKSVSIDDIDLKKQIVGCHNMPMDAKKLAIEKIEEMKSANSDYHKQLLYVKSLLNFPWPSKNDNHMFADAGATQERSIGFLDNFIKRIDEKVYGHKMMKESIKEIVGKWISNPDSSGSSIGLVGPPGVGKTLIARAIGGALGIPCVQITLGGQNDSEILHGHGYTYSGAQPGMIVKKMIESGNSRCIMFFDELDKATKKHDSNEIHNTLLHITDPNTNREFTDRFFPEIKFPLWRVIFIFSYNNPSKVDPILLDRLEQIETQPYSLMDKVNIAKHFLIKEICASIRFNYADVKIDDDEIKYLVEEYTNEAGVRELRRKIEKIFLKLNIDRIYGNRLFKKKNKRNIHVTKETIIEYLDKPHSSIQMIHDKSEVGVINGLYATDSGSGGIIPIQVFSNYTGTSSKFTLKLTGRQGKVMRESVFTAFTSAINFICEDKRNGFIKEHKYGLHIHTPSGAVPKDGPSAGAAFATAFVSRILNKKIKNTVAMTGEIELSLNVTKIGGLLYKLTGAKKAGVKLVLVSRENEEDVDKIKKENPNLINDDFNVILVDKFGDILEHVLEDYNPADFDCRV